MQVTKTLALQVVLSCELSGIEHVVVSPGSRNAPLTISFSTNTSFNSMSIVDERCAGFFALGIAQQTKKPVVLVCTSGSALLNYYPAVAEAFYSNIPLVVISADRPKHLLGIGDGQTIRQENVFANHIEFDTNLQEGEVYVQENTKNILEALHIAKHKQKPVHINVPFDEPLYDTINDDKIKQLSLKVQKYFNRFNELSDVFSTEVNPLDYISLSKIWNTSAKKLIIVGVHYPDEHLQKLLSELVEVDASVLVMTETTSNLYHESFINSIDQLITNFDDDLYRELQPDLLITIGGFVVSKRIKQFLRKYRPKYHWHVDKHQCLDTYFSLSNYIEHDFSSFYTNFNNYTINVSSNYQERFIGIKKMLDEMHSDFVESAPFSDFKVVAKVIESLPKHAVLQTSNSSIIRYQQLCKLDSSIYNYCNRGTSGIDGSTSTAIGGSVVALNRTVFLTGDISFFYDSNALWNNYIPPNFRIILVNNDGGGIFKIISGPKESGALPFFETKHGLKAKCLAEMYNFDYYSVDTAVGLDSCLTDFYNISEKPKLLEIFTPSDINDAVLKSYFKKLNIKK